MTTPPPTCEAPGCRNTPAPVLCRSHETKVGQWLADIDHLYAALDPRLSMAVDWNSTGGSGLASQRSVGRTGVMVLRDRRSRERDDSDPDGNRDRSVLEVLHAYAETVREARGLARPVRVVPGVRAGDLPGPVCEVCQHDSCSRRRPGPDVVAPAAPTVASERALLAAHLDWLLATDDASDFYRELRDVWSQLRAAHGHHRPKPAASCWVPQDDGSLCSGPVYAGRGSAWCNTCGTSWAGAEFVRISLVLGEGSAA